MSDREEAQAFNDAYYDIRRAVAPFVSLWWCNLPQKLLEEDAQREFKSIHSDLRDDGFSDWEVSRLSALAVCDIRKEMLDDMERYETET